MSTTAWHSTSNISETVRDRGLVPKDHQKEMAYGLSNGHVTDDVTWPWKVKLVTPIRLERNISKTAGFRDSVRTTNRKWHMDWLWPMTSCDPRRCCEAVRSAILATAWLLVTNASDTVWLLSHHRFFTYLLKQSDMPSVYLQTLGQAWHFTVEWHFKVCIKECFCATNMY